jgi:hypothetical protein
MALATPTGLQAYILSMNPYNPIKREGMGWEGKYVVSKE